MSLSFSNFSRLSGLISTDFGASEGLFSVLVGSVFSILSTLPTELISVALLSSMPQPADGAAATAMARARKPC